MTVETQAPDAEGREESHEDGDDDGSDRQIATSGSERQVSFSGVRVKFSTTAAAIPEKLGWNGWLTAWRTVGGVRESSKWWQGDLLNFAESKSYGQKYTQVLEGDNYGALRNIASVAGKFPADMRRADLEWSHHAAMSSLLPAFPDVVKQMLEDAVVNDWTVVQVRAAVAEFKAKQAGELDDSAPERNGGPVVAGVTVAGAPRGVLPIPDATAETDGYECPNCPDLVFAEEVFHCLNCGAHVPMSYYETGCPYCAEDEANAEGADVESDAASTTGNDAPPVSTTQTPVSGQVLTPADQNEFTIINLIEVAAVKAISTKTAAKEAGKIPDSLPRLIALYDWLGAVIDGMKQAAQPPAPTGKPLMPAPVTTTGRKGRKPRVVAPAPVSDEEMVPVAEESEPVEAGLDDADVDDLPFA